MKNENTQIHLENNSIYQTRDFAFQVKIIVTTNDVLKNTTF